MEAPAADTGSMAGKQRRIGVMTSGGDAPGMNAAVRAVVRTAIAHGCEAYGIYEGYEGLVRGGDLIKQMHWDDVRGWLSEGGTLIGTARCKSFMERPGRLEAAKNLVTRGINALVICGGDGSLTGADIFRDEWPGLLSELVRKGELKAVQIKPFRHLNIVGLVGSIDNDMASTDATIGAFSSLARICQAVDFIESTAFSHSRAFVIEVMGRHCGWLALMAGVSTGADYVFLPEHPPGVDWEKRMCEIISKVFAPSGQACTGESGESGESGADVPFKHRNLGKRKTTVIVAEGAQDRQLNKICPNKVKDVLSTELGLDTRITTLGHVQRGGTASAYDRMLATLQGIEAVEAVLEATPETPTPMIAINENKIVRTPLMEAVKLTHDVADAIKAKDFEKAMQMRSDEFEEYYRAYMITTATDQQGALLPEDKVRPWLRLLAFSHLPASADAHSFRPRRCASRRHERGHSCCRCVLSQPRP